MDIQPTDQAAVDVAVAAFRGLQRGALTGDWSGFVDLLAEDVRIMIPVPATADEAPEGVLRGKEMARMLFASHHDEKVQGARLECRRVAGNGARTDLAFARDAFPRTLIPVP